jgi:apolipoprotein N-acyltransferase
MLLIGVHYLWGVVLLFPRLRLDRTRIARFFLVPELLLVFSLVVFVFVFIFALNANMSYVQRFAESSGNLRIALDTRTERLLAFIRFFPFVLLNAAVWLYGRLRFGGAASTPRAVPAGAAAPLTAPAAADVTAPAAEAAVGRAGTPTIPTVTARAPGLRGRRLRMWALPLVFVSVMLTTLSIPSFVSLNGIGLLGWISLVPLFVVLLHERFWRGVFYGITFGVLTTLLQNYWLGTFNLISLQFTVVLWLVFYALFVPVLLFLLRRAPRLSLLVFPLAWTGFEYLTSIGFLGYPWGLVAHSQYHVASLIQISAITGVWGVSFLVVLVNSLLAHAVVAWIRGVRGPRRSALAVALLVGATLFGGALVLAVDGARNENGDAAATDAANERTGATSRVALIQQNSDPRKHDYERTLRTLKELTDRAMIQDPDMVVWSETAFVPNIRRWSREDPDEYQLADLVHRFLDYQESLDTWLVTGNDDYRRVQQGGETVRQNYNAAVLFSDSGERMDTYHKIKLVPFTEHFPYQEQLPWVYELLQDFDVSFWEPGDERTVFSFPGFRFSTPICFEDIFPEQVRRFVLSGAEVIVNLSNDYWSLTPVEAQQHFAASLFRTVENRRPMLRSTASGVTGHVDRFGRIQGTLPTYREDFMVTEVTRPPAWHTFYTRHGDWFPQAALGLLGIFVVGSLLRFARRS